MHRPELFNQQNIIRPKADVGNDFTLLRANSFFSEHHETKFCGKRLEPVAVGSA